MSQHRNRPTFTVTLAPEDQEWVRRQAGSNSSIISDLIRERRLAGAAEVAITTNPDFALWQQEIGVAREDAAIIIGRATPDDVEGRVIAGNLPLSLCARALLVVQVNLELAPGQRLDQMSLAEFREVEKWSVSRYEVRRK